jgi:hypothetical protein
MAESTLTRPCESCGRPIQLKSPKDRTRKCARCKRQTANAAARTRRRGGGRRFRRLGCAVNPGGFSWRGDGDFYRKRQSDEET